MSDPLPSDTSSTSTVSEPQLFENDTRRSRIFIEVLDDDFKCGICMDVLVQCVSCTEGHTFCDRCLSTWFNSNGQSKCPICRTRMCRNAPIRNRPLQRVIDRLRVICPTRAMTDDDMEQINANGKRRRSNEADVESSQCSWEGQYQDVQSHLAECPFSTTKCPNPRCRSPMQRRDLPSHIESCPYRPISCVHCDGSYEILSEEAHLKTCPKLIINCIFCKSPMSRDKETSHVASDCELAPVPCIFVKRGCCVIMKRSEMAQHEAEYASQHIRLLATALADCEERLVECDALVRLHQLAQQAETFVVQPSQGASRARSREREWERYRDHQIRERQQRQADAVVGVRSPRETGDFPFGFAVATADDGRASIDAYTNNRSRVAPPPRAPRIRLTARDSPQPQREYYAAAPTYYDYTPLSPSMMSSGRADEMTLDTADNSAQRALLDIVDALE